MTNTSRRILLVEDDLNFGDVLKSYLEMHDYDVTLATDGEAGWEAFKKGTFELCILDVMMPKMDGFSLGRLIREKDQVVSLIFLTAKMLKEDVIEGLKLGADDYITKPFNSEELLLRIQNIFKRSVKKPDEKMPDEFTFGKYHFNFKNRILSFNNGEEETKLSPKEAHLLQLFCVKINDILPRSEALEKIWLEDNYFTARSMDVFVTKLRKYLKNDPDVEIVNIHGNGFQLLDRSVS